MTGLCMQTVYFISETKMARTFRWRIKYFILASKSFKNTEKIKVEIDKIYHS